MYSIVRPNTFETNSSSMHSLVVTKKSRPYDNYDKMLGYYPSYTEYELFGCCDTYRFGRHPFEVLSTPKDKLRYYVAHYIGYKSDTSKIDEVKDFISKVTNLPKEHIKITATEDKWSGDEEETYGWAGINDTGEDVFDYIERNNISLEEFILDPRYTVIIDGDEYQEFKKLFLKGLMDFSNIEYISSGKHFWLDDIETFSLYYINRLVNDDVYNDLMESLDDYNNEFIKEIIIEDEDDCDICESALITFASVLDCLRHLTYSRNIPIKLILKTHTKDDYKPVLKYIDTVEIYKED